MSHKMFGLGASGSVAGSGVQERKAKESPNAINKRIFFTPHFWHSRAVGFPIT
jgi:hypothetical protein